MTKEKSAQTIPEEKVAPKQTMADKIWADLKDKQLDMFGLPGQIVSKYCQPAMIEPNRLYLVPKIGAVLPALEDAFGKKYTFELSDKFIIVAQKVL